MSDHLTLTGIDRIKDRAQGVVADYRINDNFIHLFQQIIRVSRSKKPTLVWSAEEMVVVPERAIRRVRVENIAEYMG
jgi:hypothetical protein